MNVVAIREDGLIRLRRGRNSEFSVEQNLSQIELIKSREEVRMRPRQAPSLGARFSRVAGKVAQKTLSGLKYKVEGRLEGEPGHLYNL